MTCEAMPNAELLGRLRAEFLEMPGLRLTPAQVQCLCGIDPRVCRPLLDALVDATFLRTTADGHYMRMTDGATRRPHVAKATLSATNPLLKSS